MTSWARLERGRLRPVRGPVVVVIMDGVGLAPAGPGNAWRRARTPCLDALFESASHLPLAAHGVAVGLPADTDMGNSEVGHNAIGAGRVYEQGAMLVNSAIASGRLFQGATWRWLLEGVRASGEPLHLIGLLSDGNVHSHQDHVHALLRQAAQEGVRRVRVHPLLDGRDVDRQSALLYVDRLERVLAEIGRSPDRDYRIASGGGRMLVTMDRYEADWGMVARGWQTHVRGVGRPFPSARAAIETFRAEAGDLSDQYLPAFVVAADGEPVGPIRDGASVILFNFRGDRAIELSRAFEAAALDPAATFDRGPRPQVRYAGMMQYDGDLQIPQRFLVSPPHIEHTLGEYLARNGVPQLALSETQKFGHVTYFWNGNRSGCFDEALETYIEIPSDRVPFEQRPWMKAAEITDEALRALRGGRFRHARINYPNGDMVGHTGHLGAALIAMEALDLSLGRLLDAIAELDGVALVTADHGNVEEMYGPKRRPDGTLAVSTAHSLNPVPCALFDPKGQAPALSGEAIESGRPGLVNLAATVVELLGYRPPADFLPTLLG